MEFSIAACRPEIGRLRHDGGRIISHDDMWYGLERVGNGAYCADRRRRAFARSIFLEDFARFAGRRTDGVSGAEVGWSWDGPASNQYSYKQY
jgi:hypothetical protein